MLKKLTLLAIMMFSLALVITSCSSDQAEQTTDATADAIAQNPNVDSKFIFTTYDVDGNPRSTGEWIGKQPVILNFWGTWCPPCRREIPDLVRLYNEYQPQGIEMIGLAVRDQPDAVIKYSMENGMNWVMLMSSTTLGMQYGITGVPTTIFLSRDGKELGRFVGPRDYETFKEAFELALKS